MHKNWKAWLISAALCGSTVAFAQTPATATTPAPASKAAPAAAAKAAPAAAAAPAKAAKAAAGGGAGKVWANADSKVYHCQGDRYYGTTKSGEYLTVADAKAKGFNPAKNSKNCTK